MEREKPVIGLLVILLAFGVTVVFAARPAGSDAAGHSPQALVLTVPGWEQVNSNGFGDPGAGEVTALEAFGGYLYAGTHNPIDPEPLYDGAGIFRSSDGATWTAVTLPGFGSTHDTAPPAILDLEVFSGYLYASTGRGNAAQIWRSSNGVNWAPVVAAGFGDPDVVEITALAEYGGLIYAGVTHAVKGAQIWRSFTGDSNSWTKVAPTTDGIEPATVTGMAVFSDTLYAAIESEAPAQIWRTFGGDWETAVSNGFGDADTTMTGGMAVFGSYLYVGAGNASSGAQLWRTDDGASWTQAITPAFGDANNQKTEMVFVFENQLYASTRNASSGIEIWRSADGSLWEQVNQDGFGDVDNAGSNWGNATAEFLGQLYVGTVNVADGGELWRMQQPFDVSLSASESLAGAAGQIVTYTLGITNTGTMTDAFDLVASGNSWTTAVSTTTIGLTPGAAGQFSVTVAIPPGALGNDSDLVTITATSQGDPVISDTAQLATAVVPIYGLDLSPGTASAGPPGTTVTYTLAITNTGNLTDTFDLAPSGQTWTTTLSTSQISLAPSASGQFSITVAIPPGALASAADVVSITATSQGDPAKNDAAQLATAVLPVYGLDLSPAAFSAGPPGTTVTYTLAITNTGNLTDTFDLAPSGQTWTTTLSIYNVNLAPSANARFTVTVQIPPGTADQESDVVTITATSQGDGSKSDSAVFTTTSVAAPEYGVALSAGSSLPGAAGATVDYSLTITNTGNVNDTFDLAPTGQTWTTTLSTSQVYLAPSASARFTVTVQIPPRAAGQESDMVTITATSQGDGSKVETAVLTTTSTGLPVEIYLPMVVRNTRP